MTARANWRGYLKIGELTCAVGLFTAASTSERIAFHTINRKTGHRVRRELIDSVSGKPVPSDDQAKGYEVSSGDFIVLDPQEIAEAVPESDKMLDVTAFIACRDVDTVYFDRPYYLAPSDNQSAEAYGLILEGLRSRKVVALASTVLFRRLRPVLIRPGEKGLIATTLKFDYEVRSAREAFEEISGKRIKGEMLELAEHIIKTKKGSFDPSKFEDRYEAALAELVKAKAEGREPKKAKRPAEGGKVIDLMDALRKSAGKRAKASPKKKAELRKKAS